MAKPSLYLPKACENSHNPQTGAKVRFTWHFQYCPAQASVRVSKG